MAARACVVSKYFAVLVPHKVTAAKNDPNSMKQKSVPIVAWPAWKLLDELRLGVVAGPRLSDKPFIFRAEE